MFKFGNPGSFTHLAYFLIWFGAYFYAQTENICAKHSMGLYVKEYSGIYLRRGLEMGPSSKDIHACINNSQGSSTWMEVIGWSYIGQVDSLPSSSLVSSPKIDGLNDQVLYTSTVLYWLNLLFSMNICCNNSLNELHKSTINIHYLSSGQTVRINTIHPPLR